VPEVDAGAGANRAPMARLARVRVPLGFAASLIVFWLARPTRATLVAGTAIALAGEAMRFWAAGHLNKAREVTSSGPYRWTAHPLYVGSSVMGIGLAVASRHILAYAIIGAYLVVTLTAAITREEAFLRQTFGDRYDRYRSGGDVDAIGRFRLSRAVANREYRAVAGLVLAVLLLLLKATYNGSFGGTAGSLIRPGG
jgi:protein-S-isoprenylcysteine O-methyltransferase Ste14